MKTPSRPLVIGLYAPRPQSGKSTIADMIEAHTHVARLKVSGAMKAMTAALLRETGLDEDTIARHIDGDLKDAPIPGLTDDAGGPITSRDIQKTLGKEWGRTLFGARFWTRPLRAAIEASTAPVVLIDDVRFPADHAIVCAFGGINVRIVRPLGAAEIDDHGSEGLLERHAFDVDLVNDGSLADLRGNVDRLLLPRLPLRDRLAS